MVYIDFTFNNYHSIWVPVNCETKRETKYTETKWNEIHRNETKSMRNEINRNEIDRNETVYYKMK